MRLELLRYVLILPIKDKLASGSSSGLYLISSYNVIKIAKNKGGTGTYILKHEES